MTIEKNRSIKSEQSKFGSPGNQMKTTVTAEQWPPAPVKPAAQSAAPIEADDTDLQAAIDEAQSLAEAQAAAQAKINSLQTLKAEAARREKLAAAQRIYDEQTGLIKIELQALQHHCKELLARRQRLADEVEALALEQNAITQRIGKAISATKHAAYVIDQASGKPGNGIDTMSILAAGADWRSLWADLGGQHQDLAVTPPQPLSAVMGVIVNLTSIHPRTLGPIPPYDPRLTLMR